ncbi:MAG: Bax inhibitor-1/YccA family protein [Bacteroidota bacterium]
MFQTEIDPRLQVRKQEFIESGDASAFMRQVFSTMAIGLLLTAVAAYFVSQSHTLMSFFFTGIMRWVTLLAPLGLVWYLSARVNRMSFSQASIAFGVYATILGISLATIFYFYSLGTLAKVFSITAGTFGTMALIGYTTKIDLSKMGSILYMALIGLIIAMVVNLLLVESTMMDMIISVLGVLIFSGLTAYDMQKIITIGAVIDAESEDGKKMALMGALNLYLDFINLFLFLLRLFGGRD